MPELDYKLLYDELPRPAIISDRKTGKILDCNKAAEQIMGYNREELIGKSFLDLDLLPAEDLSRAVEILAEGLQGRSTGPDELLLNRKDGSQVPVDIRTHPLKIGEQVFILGIARDITDRKEAQRQLEARAEELSAKNIELQRAQEELSALNQHLEERVRERTEEVERLLQQKNELISRLGHDLKNPLTPLLALLPIIKAGEEDSEQLELLDAALASATYLQQLAVNTLRLARLNSPAEEVSLDLVNTNLREEIEGILRRRIPAAAQSRVNIKSEVTKDTIVSADPLTIHEVLDNLLANALKFTPKGGDITLQVRTDGDFAIVSVRDTGKGMTEEQLPRIFDEFYKADPLDKDRDSTGLGLAICKRIIEQHGGTIWAESPGMGQGATFYFTLRLAKADASPERQTAEIGIAGDNGKISN
jgi:PAS domain S-box-containing protein